MMALANRQLMVMYGNVIGNVIICLLYMVWSLAQPIAHLVSHLFIASIFEFVVAHDDGWMAYVASHDRWWDDHQQMCGGQWIKIRQPEGFVARPSKKKKSATNDSTIGNDVVITPSNEQKKSRKGKGAGQPKPNAGKFGTSVPIESPSPTRPSISSIPSSKPMSDIASLLRRSSSTSSTTSSSSSSSLSVPTNSANANAADMLGSRKRSTPSRSSASSNTNINNDNVSGAKRTALERSDSSSLSASPQQRLRKMTTEVDHKSPLNSSSIKSESATSPATTTTIMMKREPVDLTQSDDDDNDNVTTIPSKNGVLVRRTTPVLGKRASISTTTSMSSSFASASSNSKNVGSNNTKKKKTSPGQLHLSSHGKLRLA
jgi:hypothetical protein